MLGAGFRKIAPAASNPDAASIGEFAIIKRVDRSDPANPKTTRERWHLTCASMDNYFVQACRESSTLTPAELVDGHNRIQELTKDLLHRQMNYESALIQVLGETSFTTHRPHVERRPSPHASASQSAVAPPAQQETGSTSPCRSGASERTTTPFSRTINKRTQPWPERLPAA